MSLKNYLGTQSQAESVDQVTLKRIFGENLARLSTEEKSTILEALKEARHKTKFLLFP
jgi:hypothetical protein